MSCEYDNYLEIKQGDSTTYYASVLSADVSNWTLWTGHWEAKRRLSDTEPIVYTTSACYDSSMWAFNISAVDTSVAGDYTYQFYLTYQDQVRTVIQDIWSVTDSVQQDN